MPDGKKLLSKTYYELGSSKLDKNLKEQMEDKIPAVVTVFKKAMTSEPKQDKKDW